MKDDIVAIKKPPASALSQQTQEPIEEPQAPQANQQAVESVNTKSSMPVGVIISAIFICLCLISVVVYSTLAQA